MDIKLDAENEMPIKCIVIRDFSDNLIRYDLIHSCMVNDLIYFLSKIPIECFFQNYKLEIEKNGKKLFNEDNLFNLDLSDYDIIRMVPCLYDSSSAKDHYNIIKYILNDHPNFCGSEIFQLNNIIFKDINKLKDTTEKLYKDLKGASPFTFFNYLLTNEEETIDKSNTIKENSEKKDEDKTTKEAQENKNKIESTKKNKKSKKDAKKDQTINTNNDLNTKTSSVNSNTNSNSNQQIEDVKQQILDYDFKKTNLSNIPFSLIYDSKCKPLKYRCLNSIYLSSYNNRIEILEAPKGDLLYIEVITLENTHLFITSSEKGFFINNCKIDLYDPSPSTSMGFISYTLPGLLSLISTTFKENFTKTICQSCIIPSKTSDSLHSNNISNNTTSSNFVTIKPKDDFLYLPSPKDKFDWIKSIENPFYYDYRFKPFNLDKINSLMYLNKEWNEEYQGILDIKNIEGMNLEAREKLLVPFYNSFKEVATEGAKLIANKTLKPFSISESPNSGYYIYGNIFITLLEDKSDFTIFNKENQTQTIYGASLDLRHINYLNKLRYEFDLKDIYFGLCCIITYKGLVLHAQVMTPGIIFNSEHLIVYGEYDDNKIRNDETFKNEISKTLNEKLRICYNDISTADDSLSIDNYLAHPEMKGVKGVDKRNYLFDLVHLMPRDLNFNDPGALIRPELLNDYKLRLLTDLMKEEPNKEKINKIQQEMDSISKNYKDPKEMQKLLEKPFEERESFYSELDKKAREKIRINTIYDTEIKIRNTKKEEIDLLHDLSKLLNDEMLDKFLTDCLKEDDNMPADSCSLKLNIHKYGISSRYYGHLIKKIEDKENYQKNLCWLKSLIIRDIIVKSARSIYNSLIKDVPNMHCQAFTAYFLNIILGTSYQVKALEYFDISEITYNNEFKFCKPDLNKKNNDNSNTITTDKEDNKDNKDSKDKKKKRKRKNKTNNNDIDVDMKYYLIENLVGSNVNCIIDNISSNKNYTYFVKPSKIWERICNYASQRYNYNIDKSLACSEFNIIESSYNKSGMLRDFCKKTGIILEAVDYKFNSEYILNKNEIIKSIYLTFKPNNITEFFPVYKDYSLPSEVLKPAYADAEAFFNQGHMQAAAERYKQVIILNHEINGPIHIIAANCHKKLAYINYYEGNIQSAISLVTKAIIIYEKLSEYDSPTVANCYSELGSYLGSIGDLLNSFKAMYKAWEITYNVYPRNHPELANRLSVLAYFFIDLDCTTNALELIDYAMKISLEYTDELDIKMNKSYLIASQLNLKNYNINNSIMYYEKYCKCIKKAYSNNNEEAKFVQNTEKILEGLKLASDELKKKHQLVKGKENTKKIFDELIAKFVTKINYDENKFNNKLYLDQNDIQLIDYMVKNGLVKFSDIAGDLSRLKNNKSSKVQNNANINLNNDELKSKNKNNNNNINKEETKAKK